MKARLCVALCALALATTVAAQDAVKTSPNNTKLVLENERVRAYEFWAKAGERIALHSHPDHLVYVMAGARLKLTTADGKVAELDLKAGEAAWIPATAHTIDVVSGDLRAVTVELKK